MQPITNDNLSMTSLLLALAVVAISIAGVVGNSSREAAGSEGERPAGTAVERTLVVDIPVKGDVAVSVVDLDPGAAILVPEDGAAPTVAIEPGSGALIAAHADRGRLVGLAMVPPDAPIEATSVAITVDATALALVGLTAGLTTTDHRALSAIWALASETPEYEDLTDAVESAMRLKFDLAEPPPDVASAAAATIDATLAELSAATPPAEVGECESEVRDSGVPSPGICVRQRSEDARFVENALPRWGQLLASQDPSPYRPSCSLVPPAADYVLVDDPVGDDQLDAHLVRVIESGKPGELVGDAARTVLGGPGELAEWLVSRDCPASLAFAAAGAPELAAARAVQSQLLTVLTRYTAPLGHYLGGTARTDDPVGAVLNAPRGSIEAVGFLERNDPETLQLPGVDLADIDSTDPARRPSRNRTNTAVGLAMLEVDNVRSIAGLRFDAEDDGERPVRLTCDDCEAATAYEPVGPRRLALMLIGIAGAASTPILGDDTGAGSVGLFFIDDGSVTATTTTTTTTVPPPPATPPPTNPPVTIITRVSFSLSYPTLDSSGIPVSIVFTANNTGTDTVVLTPASFSFVATGSYRIPPTSANFETMSVAPGEQREGVLTFDPEPGPTPDTFAVTTPKLALEIPL